ELSDRPLIGLYRGDGGLLMIREDARFFRYGRHGPEPFKTDMDTVEVSLYSSIRMADGSFVLGSISNGLYHVDGQGKRSGNINQDKGLSSNLPLSLAGDIDTHIRWGLDNGISTVNLYAPFHEYVDKLGKLGLVYAALTHKGHMFLGTNQGLFHRR